MRQKKTYPTPFQRAACWSALAWACVAFLALLIVAALYGLVMAFVALESVLLPVIIAGVLAYLLNPCVDWVEHHLRRRRVVAVLLVMCGASLLVGGGGAVIVPPLVSQTKLLIDKSDEILKDAMTSGEDFLNENSHARFVVDIFYDRLPKQLDKGTPSYGDKLKHTLNYHSKDLTDIAVRWLTAGTRALYGSVGLLVGLVLIPVFLFYFLLQSETIRQNWDIVLPIRGSRFRDEVVGTLSQINDYIVQMMVSLIDGLLLGCALKIMGLPYAVTIGAAAALLGIIPYIGMITTSIPALLLAWVTWHDVGHVATVLIIFLSVSQLDGWIFQPKILGKRLHMHDHVFRFVLGQYSRRYRGSLAGSAAHCLAEGALYALRVAYSASQRASLRIASPCLCSPASKCATPSKRLWPPESSRRMG